MPRGPKPGSGKSGGREVGKLGGRPRKRFALEVGQLVTVRRPPHDAEPGLVAKVDATSLEIAVDGGVLIISVG